LPPAAVGGTKLLPALAVVALLAAACGTRAHQRAIAVAEAYATAHGLHGRVTCSNGIGGLHPRTPDFICDVRVAAESCDELEVRRVAEVWRIHIRRRGVDCVLPA
jgi:hypothetical protein